MSATNLMKLRGAIDMSLDKRITEVKGQKKYKRTSTNQLIMSRAYFNMVPRTITPKRLRPPRPMTIALSEVPVLLQQKINPRYALMRFRPVAISQDKYNKEPELPFLLLKKLLNSSNPVCPSFSHIFFPLTPLRHGCPLQRWKPIKDITLHNKKSASK